MIRQLIIIDNIKTLKYYVNESSLLSDIENTLNVNVDKHILQWILKSKSKEEFNNYCELLKDMIIPTSTPDENDVACYITSIIWKGTTSYFIEIGKFNKKRCYKLMYQYNKLNVDRYNKRISIYHTSNNKSSIYGVLPKEIITKDLL